LERIRDTFLLGVNPSTPLGLGPFAIQKILDKIGNFTAAKMKNMPCGIKGITPTTEGTTDTPYFLFFLK
jgi:hypothetical protein